MTKFLITLFLGWAGVHKFMEKKTGIGVLYLFTFGLFGIGWIVDILKAIANFKNESPSTQAPPLSYRDNKASTLIFSKEFLIVGDKYECRKNPKKMRSDVNKKMKLDCPVYVEKYLYHGEPAYMIVDSKSKLDLGVLSKGAASWLTDYYSNGKTEAVLVDKCQGTFHVKISVYK